jgi:hypothetical protein
MWAQKIDEDFREGNVTWMGIPNMVLEVLTEDNADEVISSLSGPARESFLEWARSLSLSDDDEIISFDSEGGKPSAEQWRSIVIVRAWVQAHPLPERAEPFPVAVVEGLLSRVSQDNRRLIPLIQKNRRHPERALFERTASVAADLENALHVATRGAENPQAQAFAWNLLDRALGNIDGFIEATEDERRLIEQRKMGRAV